MDPIIIRAAQKKDIKAIRALFIEYDKEVAGYFPKNHMKLLKKIYTKSYTNAQREKTIPAMISQRNNLFLVMEVHKKIVGCGMGWIYTSQTKPSTKIGYFDEFTTQKNIKDKKMILTKLFIELEKWFNAKKCRYIKCQVVFENPMKKFYKKLGFDSVIEEMRKIL